MNFNVSMYVTLLAQAALVGLAGYGMATSTMPFAFGLSLLLLTVLSFASTLLSYIRSLQASNSLRDGLILAAEGKLSAKDTIEESADVFGGLALQFNRMSLAYDNLRCMNEGYLNVIDSIPDPVFAVDEEFNFLLANRAVRNISGLTPEQLKKRKCREIFNANVCGTSDCPIEQAKRVQGTFETDIVKLQLGGQDVYIKPVGDIVRDCHGKHIGYVEVARVVTPMVLREMEIKGKFDALRAMTHEITQASALVAGTTEQINSQVEMVSQGTDLQRERVAETATAMDQMGSTILEVARNASAAAEQAESAKDRAASGAKVVAQSVAAIGKVQDLSAQLKRNMSELGDQAEAIGRIMTVISDIADQTNLLALNAAIEAARAGDAGRGFAVVADEVRKLAEKTMGATKEVGQAIQAIQEGTRRNIAGMDDASVAVDEATSLAGESGRALAEIVKLIQTTSDMVQSIATASEEQSAAGEQINRAISDINRVSSETAEGMAQTAHAIGGLNEMAGKLKTLAAIDI